MEKGCRTPNDIEMISAIQGVNLIVKDFRSMQSVTLIIIRL